MKNSLKLLLTLIISVLCFSLGQTDANAGLIKKDMHFADTLHTPWKIDQFLKAVEVAPKTWVYKEVVWKDANTVTIKNMRFNDSMENTLKADLVTSDNGLFKRMSNLYKLIKPLNVTLDMTISYKKLPQGLAISYDLNNIKIGGGKKDD